MTLLHKFGAREEDAYTEEEEEEKVPKTETQPATRIRTNNNTNAEASPPRITRQVKQEARDKARAWHINWQREKEKKTKKMSALNQGKENNKNATNTGR